MRSIQATCSGFIRTERRQAMVSRSARMAGGRFGKNASGNSATAR